MDTIDQDPRAGRAPATLVFFATLAALALVIVAVLTFVLSGGDDAPERIDRLSSVVSQSDDEDLAIAASSVIETFEVFGAKNPFERPLPLEQAPTTVPPTTQPGDPGDGGGNGSLPTTTPTTQPDDQPDRGKRVSLTEVYDTEQGTVANVVVDGVLYSGVGEGDVFAEVFQVVSLDLGTGCGEFLMGDVDFELCVGQEILK